ncbi:MAG: hypothetical protein JO224_05955 [Pelomonas sp.]|nr:hypothetical protein [Roseateles sp.]
MPASSLRCGRAQGVHSRSPVGASSNADCAGGYSAHTRWRAPQRLDKLARQGAAATFAARRPHERGLGPWIGPATPPSFRDEGLFGRGVRVFRRVGFPAKAACVSAAFRLPALVLLAAFYRVCAALTGPTSNCLDQAWALTVPPTAVVPPLAWWS